MQKEESERGKDREGKRKQDKKTVRGNRNTKQ